MQIKKIAMLVVAGCAIGMLTGCGIPEEEHNAAIKQLQDQMAKMEEDLNGTIADKESLLKSEKAKVRTARIELDDASERIKALQSKNTESSKELIAAQGKLAKAEEDLAASKSKALTAQDKAIEAETKYNALSVEHDELKRRFEDFKKNMASMGGSSTSSAVSSAAPATTTTASPAPVTEKKPAPATQTKKPKSNSEAVMSILDQMGNQ